MPFSRPLLALLICALFFAAGYPLIRQLGLQHDEVLFTNAVLFPFEFHYAIDFGGHQFTAMILPYLGTLKAHLYSKFFHLVYPNAYTIRLPLLALSALTLFLFWAVFRLTLGHLVAFLLLALLAVDPLYLLTSTLDWGPVVFQRFFLAAGLLAFVFYHRSPRPWLLFLGAFCWGLGVWDKATFFWLIGAYTFAAFLLFPAAVIGPITSRRLGLLLLAGTLGAAPFVYFNLQHPLETLTQSPHGKPLDLVTRTLVMQRSLDGSALFDYLTRDDTPPAPLPHTTLESTGLRLSALAGQPRHHLLLPALLLAIAYGLYVRRTFYARGILFGILALLAGWLIMFAFAQGGQGAHHIVLLWPLPHLIVACAIAELANRFPARRLLIAGSLGAVLCLSSAAVSNEYYAQIVRNGPDDYWTTADEPLRAFLVEAAPNAVYPLEWGLVGPLRALGRGKLPLGFTPEWLESGYQISPKTRADILSFLTVVKPYFLRYADRSRQNETPVNRLLFIAGEMGFEERPIKVINDRHGRPMVLVTQFVPK